LQGTVQEVRDYRRRGRPRGVGQAWEDVTEHYISRRFASRRTEIAGSIFMTVRVAINGFGRIGRNILRAIVEAGRKDIEVVAVNDLGPVETNAHLLRFHSVHGPFPSEVGVDGDALGVDGRKIKVTAIKNPAELPHKALGV